MLTCYGYSTTRTSSAAGIKLLLVGDSTASVIYGYDTATEITLEEMIPLVRGIVRGAGSALVVADLPFGTYEISDKQAVLSATKMMRETGTHMVKIEGGVRVTPRIKALVSAGIPVMARIGFTPQSVNALSGFKVRGRGTGAGQLHTSAHVVTDVGAATVVLEMVPANLATEITYELSIPTYDIDAGNQCDGQVLAWQNALTVPADGRRPSFGSVFEEADEMLAKRTKQYVDQVHSREFPAEA